MTVALVKKKSGVRDVDTVTFFPKRIPCPKTTTEDYLNQSVGDILALLKQPKSQLPFLQYGSMTQNTVQTIAKLLHLAVLIPKQNPLVDTRLTINPPSTVSPVPTLLLPPVAEPRLHGLSPLTTSPTMVVPNKLAPVLARKPARTPVVLRVHQNPRVSTRHVLRSNQPPRHVSELPNRFQRSAQDATTTAQHPTTTPSTATTDAFLSNMFHPVTGSKENYNQLKKRDPDRWTTSMANELGRLASGVGTRMPTDTGAIFFIRRDQAPPGHTTTYANAICNFFPLKDNKYRVSLTVQGDWLEYPGNPSAPVASLLYTKLLVNSTISTPRADFFLINIKDFFLNNPMTQYEYMKTPYGGFLKK